MEHGRDDAAQILRSAGVGLLAVLLTVLLVMPAASARSHDRIYVDEHTYIDESDMLTYSDVPRTALPVLNIYDPETHQNEDITEYSFEELDAFLSVPLFLRWNDELKVCESMLIMFGRAGRACPGQQSYGYGLTPATARAYVSFEIIPPPTPIYANQKLVVMTDPITPPWAPTYQPYHPYDPYW